MVFMHRRAESAGRIAAGILAVSLAAAAGAIARPQAEAPPAVTAARAANGSLKPDAAIEVTLSRPLRPEEGRIGMMIGNLDVSPLVTRAGLALRYQPRILALPGGSMDLVVYLVSTDDTWRELARFPIRIGEPDASPAAAAQPPKPSDTTNAATGSPGRRFHLKPALTAGMKSQAASSVFPKVDDPRHTFADATMQGNLQGGFSAGPVQLQSQFDLVGTSFRNEALRFGQMGNTAPRVDLSGFLITLQVGKATMRAGQLNIGRSRHLINSFASRGVELSVPLRSWLDFSAAAVNGSNIVGWSNFGGLNNKKHQVLSGTLGLELYPKRPGGARLEFTVMDASVLPLAGFNQGVVSDAEKSRGFSGRVILSDGAQRFRLDGAFTRNLFTNPHDPTLAQQPGIVEVGRTWQNAHYVDASAGILRNLKLGGDRLLNLNFNFRQERLDPLFRSPAAPTQADRMQNQFELAGSVAQVQVQYSHTRFHNNLDDLNSIMTTLTRQNALQVAAPLAAIFGNASRTYAWLPQVSFSNVQVRSRGRGFPPVGFISQSQVPDQVSSVQTAGIEWQVARWRWGYRFNRSFQDNRQPERESADLRNLVSGWTAGVAARDNLDLGWDLNVESARNFEANQTDRLWKTGLNANWRMTPQMTLMAALSATMAGDLRHDRKSRNAETDIQWSYRLGFGRSEWKRIQSQVSIRYANRYARISDNLAGFSSLTRLQTLNVTLSFSFF